MRLSRKDCATYADLVLLNGKVVTVDASESVAEAVAVKFGRILAVGSNTEIGPLAGPGTRVVDLRRRTVVPGFNDTHCHISMAEGLQRAMGTIDAGYEAGVRSVDDVLARIAAQAGKKAVGDWINVINEDQSRLAEKRHPDRWELDRVAPEHPVMVTATGGLSHTGAHFAVVNSKALQLAGVTRDTPDPPGGSFERDAATGELTGRIHETATQIVQPVRGGRAPTIEELAEGIRWMAWKYVASGLTCAYDGMVKEGATVLAYQRLHSAGELPLRIRIEVFYGLLPHLASAGIVQGFGNDMLMISGIKIVTDGSIAGFNAATSDPYPGRPDYYGEMAITTEELRQVILEGFQKGYRFSVHANGDRAVNIVLDAMEEAQQKYPRPDPRNRVLHCSISTPGIIARLKRLNILVAIPGPYLHYHGDKIVPAFEAARLERMFAARDMLDAGLKVAAHSDHLNLPYAPLLGIHALVNRKTAKGQPLGTGQRISVMEALKLYTINPAYHTFEENILGSLEPGKLADLVVLGRDILTVPEESILDIPVDMTVVRGRIVYQREE